VCVHDVTEGRTMIYFEWIFKKRNDMGVFYFITGIKRSNPSLPYHVTE